MNLKIMMVTGGQLVPSPHDLPVGGAALQAIQLSQALQTRGVHVCIAAPRTHFRTPPRTMVKGVPVWYVPTLRWLLWRRGLRRIGALVHVAAMTLFLSRYACSYDVIHVHSASLSAVAGVLAGRRLSKPIVIKVMNSGPRNDILLLRTASGLPGAGSMAAYLRHATRVVALNRAAIAELQDMGFAREQIVHIPNGVDAVRISPITQYRIEGPIRVLYIGRLHPTKGVQTLIAAIALCRQFSSLSQWRLTLVGDGPQRPILVQQARSLSLTDHVEFVGQVNDVVDYLHQAHIFVLPSNSEGISNALLEAMAAGLPCVATDNAGNMQVLTHGEDGLMVPVGDEMALAKALVELGADEALRARLGRQARRTVERRFHIKRVAEQYLDLYHQILEERNARHSLSPVNNR
ncbi:MAG: glycosyltransferase family 4 protein [Anaerolineae bacterium]|nr:glycosyltransferase family 4 protein [Anaerolineae bacterium]